MSAWWAVAAFFAGLDLGLLVAAQILAKLIKERQERARI